MDEDRIIEERKKKIIGYFRKSPDLIFYGLLVVVVGISVWIRTRNLAGLRDITTGGWTLGPDLDPFLFLRWAKHIVENGSLMTIDMMRYLPLGYGTKGELILLPYLIAWFHSVASIFGSGSVEQSAALFPVFMFAITVVAFFLFVRKAFLLQLGNKKANIAGIIAGLFLSIIPVFLPRTIAGIPEKESAAFFFMFMAFYFFISAWNKEKMKKYLPFSVLAGLFTGMMALVWGGYIYIWLTISIVSFLIFTLRKDKDFIYKYLGWLVGSLTAMIPFSTRYSVQNLILSPITGVAIFLAGWFVIETIISSNRIKIDILKKYDSRVTSFVILIVLGIVFVTVLGQLGTVFVRFTDLLRLLTTPTVSRFGLTVAENRQPYFTEWQSSFGPLIVNFPIFFWLILIASVYLIHIVSRKFFNKKTSAIVSVAYALFLLGSIFSRYSPSSILNGNNLISTSIYFGSILVLIGVTGYYYLKNRESLQNKPVDVVGPLIITVLFVISILSARGAIRLVLMVVPPASALVGFLFASTFPEKEEIKTNRNKTITFILLSLLLLVSFYHFFTVSEASAQGYVPSVYNYQWQNAMSWVRANTPADAVFVHWWDYGYWVQTIGQRATVLDGGNAIVYWNHLMGRHVLTSPDRDKALEFMYAHDVTHLLIDSSDIGKYTAYSSIGSDENYDRRSWINTFIRDNTRVYETKNKTAYVYQGGFTLDEDVTYDINGTKVFFPGLGNGDSSSPGNLAGIAGFIVQEGKDSIEQPESILIYQGRQYNLPVRYAFYENEIIDFGSGIEAGVMFIPSIVQDQAGLNVQANGAIVYLSNRTWNSQLVQLYLLDQTDENFVLVHKEDDFVVSNLKQQGFNDTDFVFYQGFRGPIKIWEINYPSNIQLKEEYLQTEYPNQELYLK